VVALQKQECVLVLIQYGAQTTMCGLHWMHTALLTPSSITYQGRVFGVYVHYVQVASALLYQHMSNTSDKPGLEGR
jgi:hypothetical protein